MPGALVAGGLLRVRWFAVRVEVGDVAPLALEAEGAANGGAHGPWMVEGLSEARDHRTVALLAFQGLARASHVFTVAESAPRALVCTWKRLQFIRELGEVEAAGVMS